LAEDEVEVASDVCGEGHQPANLRYQVSYTCTIHAKRLGGDAHQVVICKVYTLMRRGWVGMHTGWLYVRCTPSGNFRPQRDSPRVRRSQQGRAGSTISYETRILECSIRHIQHLWCSDGRGPQAIHTCTALTRSLLSVLRPKLR
jgi:hypothetical protein